jgi:peptidoglycan glycosyltransferase
MNDFLTGANGNLSTLVDKVVDKVAGRTQQGNSLVLTLDVQAQRQAQELLESACGAAVALEPSTGQVLVLASSPAYDLNLVADDYREILDLEGPCRPAAPLLNRGTAGLYTPGSTFKVVTAAAALESRRFTPESEFDDPGYCVLYGKRVTNFADQSGPQVFGRISLAEALENSVNSVFCEIGKELGPIPILETARRFGFYERPPLETPESERYPSGLYRNGDLWYPERDPDVDAGRMAFGQERMLVTPLQMAIVAGAIGVGGRLLEPQAVDRIVSPSGKVVLRQRPQLIRAAVSRSTADAVASMMRLAVSSGTGTAAQIPGWSVGGKTGTGETGVPGSNTTWFIAFASPDETTPAELAIAVVLQDQAGTGGETAAPIARAVMEAILSQEENP